MPEQIEILSFLEQLSIAELRAVMDSPFEPEVMRLLEKSDVLTEMVATVLEQEHQSFVDAGELPGAATVNVQAKELIQKLSERLSSATPGEQEMLRNLGQQLEASIKFRESRPPVDRLQAVLSTLHIDAERVRRWTELAVGNAGVFADLSPHLVTAQFLDHEEERVPAAFSAGDITIQLDKREPLEMFVVEVESANEADCDREFEIILLGGTGQQRSLTVRLDQRKGKLCFGVGTIPDPEKLFSELGPYIVPLIKGG